ncbi:MAG: GIY-YIG nuclease family protein [Muriicola sp.]|nr:GIY-YIG nuclease family protein [Muriicola sp.]
MHCVYVIQSKLDASFYIGETSNLEQRLHLHNSQDLNEGRTKRKIPWEVFYVLETKDRTTAIKIEKHIKRMKSRKYIEDLKNYPEIAKKLLEKYS